MCDYVFEHPCEHEQFSTTARKKRMDTFSLFNNKYTVMHINREWIKLNVAIGHGKISDYQLPQSKLIF